MGFNSGFKGLMYMLNNTGERPHPCLTLCLCVLVQIYHH